MDLAIPNFSRSHSPDTPDLSPLSPEDREVDKYCSPKLSKKQPPRLPTPQEQGDPWAEFDKLINAPNTFPEAPTGFPNKVSPISPDDPITDISALFQTNVPR